MSKILMVVFILSMCLSVYNLIDADYIWATIFAVWTITGIFAYICDMVTYINKLEARIVKLEDKQ